MQNIKGLEAAYQAVYGRRLIDRVKELHANYNSSELKTVCTELNDENSVPCFWSLPELVDHYNLEE